MKTVKVCDSYEMPPDVRDKFFEMHEGNGNDCYVTHFWGDCKIVDKWLISEGAKKGEELLISHSW